MDDRHHAFFSMTGESFLWGLQEILGEAPMPDFWSILEGYQRNTDPPAGVRESRLVVQHIETEECFNLIQKSYNYQEYLIIHSCADTIYQLSWSEFSSDWWRPNYNVPASVMTLTYPEGTTPSEFLGPSAFTVVGTSQFIFMASEFEKGGLDFSSEGIFGFLDAYDDLTYKIVGGLPADNLTLRPLDFQHHFWESGYQNFSVRFVDGSTFHLTTFQVHDLSDLIEDFAAPYLLPLLYFEEGTEEYSGRIAGELHDCWRLGDDATSYNIGDHIYMGAADGQSILGMVFKDGEDLVTGAVVRYK